ncbi:hypothetical protein OG897_21600 [Streptomyces sp. NBC_00237]|uniref:hypothetical protein n=1 Tax=Streptomyces sp. NBC_00237 TaxID=2975687 RepID=UPI002250568B|nr:hypothetical protein [Streptomyces sp. NBC_00237]MCX5204034.1 hypothetical protein [Streptomyces sp. NBC_00237]
MNATTRTEDKSDDETVKVEAAEATEATEVPEGEVEDVEEPRPASAGVGAGAGAVVSAALGLAALAGTWPSRVLAERETLVGQLGLSKASAPSAQIEGLYGNGWHMTALVNGGFALLALLVGVGVLVALRAAGSGADVDAGVAVRPVWMRAVAWGGVILGLIGLLVSTGMYFDLFASLPTPPAA